MVLYGILGDEVRMAPCQLRAKLYKGNEKAIRIPRFLASIADKERSAENVGVLTSSLCGLDAHA